MDKKIRISRFLFLCAVIFLHYTFASPVFLDSPSNVEEEHADSESHGEGSTRYSPGDPEFLFYVSSSIFLILFAGAMSGLTVGYLSIDEL